MGGCRVISWYRTIVNHGVIVLQRLNDGVRLYQQPAPNNLHCNNTNTLVLKVKAVWWSGGDCASQWARLRHAKLGKLTFLQVFNKNSEESNG